MSKSYSKVEIKKLPKSQVEIEVKIETSVFDAYRKKTLKTLALSLNLAGFRKGKVPENVAASRLGEMKVLEEAARIAIEESFVQIVEEKKMRAVGQPNVVIKKLAPGNPLEFTLIVSVIESFRLPDYKSMASNEPYPSESVEITGREIDEVLSEIRRERVHSELHKNNIKHDREEIGNSLPEFSDEWARSIGQFKDLSDLHSKIRDNLIEEKKRKAKEKRRESIIEKILERAEGEVPEILVENEVDMMFLQFKDQLSMSGANYDNYLKTVKKTETDLRNDWRERAEKKVKMQILLTQIGREEKISVPAEEIQKEITKILTVYQNADSQKARNYVSVMLANERVLEFLEGLATVK